jgi:hypothetical protein
LKALQLAVNAILPEDLRDYARKYDMKGVSDLMSLVAERHPELYEKVSKDISDIGRNAAYRQGETLRLSDMHVRSLGKKRILEGMDAAIAKLDRNDPGFGEKRGRIWLEAVDAIQKDATGSAFAEGNNLANSIVSGARGKPAQLRAMLSTPGLYADHKGNTIPLFVRHSFGEGLRPAELLAGTYGARTSVMCLEEHTGVRMADGTEKRIKDIVAGEWVMGASKDGDMFPVRVVRVFEQGKQPVYRYSGKRVNNSEDYSVECTSEHKFLFSDKRTYQRQRSRFLRGNGPPPLPETRHDYSIYAVGEKRKMGQSFKLAQKIVKQAEGHDADALLVGLLTGDGCLTGRSRLLFSCADKRLIDDLNAVLEPTELVMRPRAGLQYELCQKNYTPLLNKSIVKGVQGFVPGGKSRFRLLLEDAGLAGCYAYEKDLPKGIQNWDDAKVASYLAGIIATDGSIYFSGAQKAPRVGFAFSSKKLTCGLRELLRARFGIYASVVTERATGGFGSSTELRKHPMWEFCISADCDLKTLWALLPPIPGVKEDRRKKAEGYRLTQLNPFPKVLIKTAEFLGVKQCFDLEVEHPDHLFVLANGMVTSNSSKKATAKGGDWGKQLAQAAAHLVVTERDCGTANGTDLDPEDPSLKGRVLAVSAAGIPAGTLIGKKELALLRKEGRPVVARSVLSCQAGKGVCARCVGRFHENRFPHIGESVGATSAHAVSEPVAQGALNVKHLGGISSGKKVYSGFDYISQFTQVPEAFRDRAVVAELDGTVEDVSEAPQGGFHVTVSGERHYVPPGHEVSVKPGEEVESGQDLAEGLKSPADVVRLRGLGEGRRYYADRLKQMLDDSGMEADLRNTEMVARAVLDEVVVTDPDGLGDYLPDDAASYGEVMRNWAPPKEAARMPVQAAKGKYLQSPALHYTVGTRITPSVAARLEKAGFPAVDAADKAPGFSPEMSRLRTATHAANDWMSSMHTSYLKKQLVDSAARGTDSNVAENLHFAPRMAIGEGFAKNVGVTGMF